MLDTVVAEVHAALRGLSDGTVATYIPELARADPDGFGVAVVGVDGRVALAGDAERPFTIQSCSKPMMYGLALEERGPEVVHTRVDAEPTGDRFNSIIKLDGRDRPHNPMINAGAIAVTSLIGSGARHAAERSARILAAIERYTGRPAVVDGATFESERATGHRNRAIAHLMLNYGAIDGPLDEHLDLYFQQCSVLVTARDLAVAAATLANGGLNPLTSVRALDARWVRDVLAVMFTCGLYDGAGQWAREVGLPAKSGVGGGILAVAPGRFGIGVFSPRLDARGNSVRGVEACRELSRRLGLHVFA